MHIILATVGTDGDVVPYVGLGRVLRARGHRVTLAAPESYRARAATLGLGFVPLATAEEEGRMLADPDLWHPLRCGVMMARWGAPMMPRQYEALAGLARGRGAVVVANPGLLPARLVQEKLNVPMASLLLQPGLIPNLTLRTWGAQEPFGGPTEAALAGRWPGSGAGAAGRSGKARSNRAKPGRARQLGSGAMARLVRQRRAKGAAIWPRDPARPGNGRRVTERSARGETPDWLATLARTGKERQEKAEAVRHERAWEYASVFWFGRMRRQLSAIFCRRCAPVHLPEKAIHVGP